MPSLWEPSAYLVDWADSPELVGGLYERVWRTTLDRPGFAVVRFRHPVSSDELRAAVVAVVAGFDRAARAAGGPGFVFERLGRFDQQVTSRFHRDGAPPASLLVLGYEPSPVRGRVFVADAHRAADRDGRPVADYLAAHNPMFPAGEERLRPFATELAVPHGESFVVVINNSLMPEDGRNPLGVLHKAEVPSPDLTARRVINSAGAMIDGEPAARPKSAAEVEHFLTRTDLD